VIPVAPKGRKHVNSIYDNMAHYMKIVPVDTCIQCKQQCGRGLSYIDHMAEPGAIGYGVPCILTKGNKSKEKGGAKK
jgi:hypothetical protein